MTLNFQFESISSFLAMGGYGLYVWLGYGISLLAIVLLIIRSKHEIKQTLQLAKKEQKREEKIKG